jgi:hypothetical protein
MTAGRADEYPEAALAPNGVEAKELLTGALVVLNALSATAERPKDEQIDALRAAVRFAEDNNCSDITDRAFEIALDKLGFTQAEADREIFLEALGKESPSKFEEEYLVEEKAAKEAWLNGDPPKGVANNSHGGGISIDDFHAYMPMYQYIFAPARDIWPAASINARLPKVEVVEDGEAKQITASAWLDRNKPVEQMTWAPGMPTIIRDRLISLGGWIDHKGVNVFNLYRPPTIRLGDPTKASPWMKHLRRVYPDGASHIAMWLAHRVQRRAASTSRPVQRISEIRRVAR